VQIGNSRGVRIPKLLLDQADLGEDVELALEETQIVIRRAHNVREGWEEAFRAMAQAGDDVLLDEDTLAPTDWDEAEWVW
jgi:antitoxin MazE